MKRKKWQIGGTDLVLIINNQLKFLLVKADILSGICIYRRNQQLFSCSGPDQIQISSKRPWGIYNHGLIKLGTWGVCGLKWKPDGCAPGTEPFFAIMQRIPVATNKTLRTLWQHREVWPEIADLFKRADSIKFEDFKRKVTVLFAKMDILVELSFPNNHFGLEQGFRPQKKLLKLDCEDQVFKKALSVFLGNSDLKPLYYQLFGLDLLKLTEAERKVLCGRWEEHDLGVTGRVVIEPGLSRPIDWIDNRMGRRDYHIGEDFFRGKVGSVS
jgi:hypothetical protein